MGTSSGAYELNHECASIFYYRDNTRVHMGLFDSNTTVPLQCDTLVFLESVCCKDVIWLTVPWDPNKILQRRFCDA